jgi:hemerythrin
MTSFIWDEIFETGFSEVDQQHQQLVSLINQFGDCLTENSIQVEVLESVVEELIEYSKFHFQEEENLMAQSGLDPRHIEQHMDAHKGFLAEVLSIKSLISPGSLDMAKNLLNFLTHWLAYHILGTDQNMARQLNLLQAGISPEQAYEKENTESDLSTEALLKALNGLFRQVSIRNMQLKDLNESLETRIEERTRELSEANRHLETVSLTDPLTQLPNRRCALRQLSLLWDESIKSSNNLVCIVIDADNFKEVNDNYGHDAGDRVLISLANTLSKSFRTDDIVSRIGGDEFLIICPDTDGKGGKLIAENTLETVSHLRVPTGQPPWIGSISVGVACRKPEMQCFEDLIKAADVAVYAAKTAGKNCVRLNE